MTRWAAPLLLATSLHAVAIGLVVSSRASPSPGPTAVAIKQGPPEPAGMQLVLAAPPVTTSTANPPEASALAQRTSRDSTEQAPPPAPAPSPAPDVYLPRNALSIAPRPQNIIDIAFPPGLSTPGQHEVTLALYIDENGHVREVKPLSHGFRQDLFDAARVAFLDARFSPGEVNGRAVKSFIRVTVVSEETPAVVAASDTQRAPPAP
jgi:hypothetical protein